MIKGGMSLNGDSESAASPSGTYVGFSQQEDYDMCFDDDEDMYAHRRKKIFKCSNCSRFVGLIPVVAAFIVFVLTFGISRAIQLSTAK